MAQTDRQTMSLVKLSWTKRKATLKSGGTCPEWLLWKVSSQGGLEPATETQRKQPIPPTASGGQQGVRDENNYDIDDIVLKYS